MPKVTRKERLRGKEAPPVRPRPPVTLRPGSELRQAFCPVCGHSQSNIKFWERTRQFDPNKPFGVILAARGRSSLNLLGYFNPEDDTTGLFPLVKERFLSAIEEWLFKKWISQKEVEELFG